MPETNADKAWYVVKQPTGSCILSSLSPTDPLPAPAHWGPFGSEQEAIAKRVGLIRAGKCQPV